MTVGPENATKPQGLHVNEMHIIRHAATARTHRPPAERLADPGFLKLLALQEITIVDIPSPYKDSRKGSEMNVASLDTLTQGETQQMLDSYGWLRDKFLTYTGNSTGTMTNHQFWDFCYVGIALPIYLILRGQNPINRLELPEVVGNIFKASIGFRNSAQPTLDPEELHTYESAGELYTTANRKHLFYQSDVPGFKTCAANEPLITKTANAMLFGTDAKPGRSELPEYISDEEFGNLVEFSKYYRTYDVTFQEVNYRRITRERMHEIMADLQNGVNEVLERDPNSIPPPSPADLNKLIVDGSNPELEFVTPPGGPLQTAIAETHEAGARLYREKQRLAREGLVYHQRTTKKKKKRK